MRVERGTQWLIVILAPRTSRLLSDIPVALLYPGTSHPAKPSLLAILANQNLKGGQNEEAKQTPVCALPEEGRALSQWAVALPELPTSIPETTTSHLNYRKGDKMTLQEAIKVKEHDMSINYYEPGGELELADKLLIEAGKRLDKERTAGPSIYWGLLPGETKE